VTTTRHLPSAVRQRDSGAPTGPARISFRQPVSSTGFVDAAWWPRSRDLATELPGLLDVLWAAARQVTRITYNLAGWDPAPRRMSIQGRTVRLGGFNTSDPHMVRLSDTGRRERIDVLVILPGTDQAVAERALRLAGEADSAYCADEILALAGTPPQPH